MDIERLVSAIRERDSCRDGGRGIKDKPWRGSTIIEEGVGGCYGGAGHIKKSHSRLFEKAEDKYVFIAEYRSEHSVEKMCLVFKVSRSRFYYWLSRPESRRKNEKVKIPETIKKIRQSQPKKEVYGALRMFKDLKAKGFCSGKNRVAAIMQNNGIRSKIKRKFKRTTDSEHSHPVAPNILQQNFSVDGPNKAYVTDITYVRTAEGWLYLAVVLDLFSHMVVGWFTSSRISKELVREALQRAIKARNRKRVDRPF